MINCILTGVGGQGTVLASKLIAQSAIEQGLFARTAETIGMAQRGGCVVSHVRIGDAVYSPMIPLGSADLLMGFEPAEAVRALDYLKDGGVAVVSNKAVKPVTAALQSITAPGSTYEGAPMLDYLKSRAAKLVVVDTEAICAACKSPKVVNVALLGAAVQTGVLGFTLADVETTIRNKLPQKFHEINLKALHLGAEAAERGID